MSKISKEGYEQILVIKSALDSMYDKLSGDFFVENNTNKLKNIEDKYLRSDVFKLVQSEFEAIAGIVELSGTWEEVQ